MTVAGVPRTVTRGRWYTARVRVRLASRQVRRTVKVSVSGASKLRASTTIVLERRGAARKPAAKGPLAGRYFWGFKTQPSFAWDNYAVHFVDGTWAYYGFPPGGLPRCTRQTEVPKKDGSPSGEGCRRYTLNAKTGALTVGIRKGSFKNGKLVLDGVDVLPLTIPQAGARYAVQLEHKGFNGLCGFATGCTTTAEYLSLSADGEFVRGGSSTSSVGGVGAPFVWGSRFPPDQTGSYEVLSGGRIRFSYLDGSKKVETIGIERNAAGQPDAAKAGIVIGGTNFYVGKG